MSSVVLDPLIHDPRRLRILATLAALPAGDELTLTRLRDMIGLPAGSPISHVAELGRAGYVRIGKTAAERAPATIALTSDGRAALDRYTAALRQLGAAKYRRPAPGVRAGHADREAVAAALAEHFAEGRLTFDELSARLDATLAATAHGDLYQATRDLPDLAAGSHNHEFFLDGFATGPRVGRSARRRPPA